MEPVWNDSFYKNLKSALRDLNLAILLCAMLFALCVPAEAQQPGKIPRIGLLISSSTGLRLLPMRSGRVCESWVMSREKT